jgi:ABC-type oligopeptide transport system substrate-binding subunit
MMMTRRRITLMCLLVLVGFLALVGEALAESKIAFSGQVPPAPNGYFEIFSMNPDGSNIQQLTNHGTGFSAKQPDWSPDGTEIMYYLIDDVGMSLRIMSADGSNNRELIPAGEVYIENGPTWSPEIPPSVATLSPTNQTIAVFLLGMIASALIMRGRQGTTEQT